ncbi:MAG: serine hydroxymethyltransferase, partial [Gammaproteobacteria bacterium]|nr:serine hydroxymethyltransferase [Gammaproteobacteria bacterium]
RANITLNKNAVPNDPRSPFVTSGLRMGTPAITTRGFKVSEAQDVANWICDILDNLGNPSVEQEVKEKVIDVCSRFPLYKGIL